MALEIVIPRLGWSMEEGTFLGWLKNEGDSIKIGDPLFELEGEKSAQEIESVDAGILHIPVDSPAKGTVVNVGAIIGYLLAPGEPPPAAGETPDTTGDTKAGPAQAEPIAPAIQASAAAEPPAGRINASPRARRVAQELGVDWRTVSGQGTSGRVREQDVRAAAASGSRSSSPPSAGTQPVPPRRRMIAERLSASRQQTVPVTLTTRATVSALVKLREEIKSHGTSVIPSYQDMIILLAAAALRRHPGLASRWERTIGGEDRLISPGPDPLAIGFAVDTTDGLLVPVIPGVEHLSLVELAGRTRAAIGRAQAGRLSTADASRAVFTLTNLGAFGIDAFTPVLHDGQTAILGLGAIRRELIVRDDGSFAPEHLMALSLTFDHRVLDGAPAAKFLQDLAASIAQPTTLLTKA